jgi:GAF domain-containing protein
MLFTNPATGLLEVLGTEGEIAVKAQAIIFQRHFRGLEDLRQMGKTLAFEPTTEPTGKDEDDPLPKNAPLPGLHMHHILLCPLLEEGELHGIVILLDNNSGDPFNPFQQMVMDDLSHVISSAIAIARQRGQDIARNRLQQRAFR